MADIKRVIKTPACLEDIEVGVGKTRQVRAGKVFDLYKVQVPVAVVNEQELAAIDISKYQYARVDFTEYEYDKDSKDGIRSIFGQGSWVIGGLTKGVRKYVANNYCQNVYKKLDPHTFETGAKITNYDQVLKLARSGDYYLWIGDIPHDGKTVRAGTNPDKEQGWINVGTADLLDVLGANGSSRWATVTKFVPKDVFIRLDVPSKYPTIQHALGFIASWIIRGTVEIKVADGTYNLTSPVFIEHPDGNNIRIVGNQISPKSCVIKGSNPTTFSAFTVTNGRRLGFLDGFYITVDSKQTLDNNNSGILAHSGAFINCGPNIVVSNWYYGISAQYNSTILCDKASVSYAGDVGIWAFCSSHITCNGANSSYCSDKEHGWGFGIQAEFCSQVNCEGAETSHNNIAGIAALSNSQVRAHGSKSNNNDGSGFLAQDQASIEGHNCIALSNGKFGVESRGSGRIYAFIQAANNKIQDYSSYAYLDNTEVMGARIAASSGNMRIDTTEAGMGVYINTAGGGQLQVSDTENSANRVAITGSTSKQPVVVYAEGNDDVIDILVRGKGQGSGLRVNNELVLKRVEHVGYVQIKDVNGVICNVMVGGKEIPEPESNYKA